MIKKIKSIRNFAVFNDFNWDVTVKGKGNSIAEFKKLNIIYGRNYSGKTTLSRILRSLEQKKLPIKYSSIEFEVLIESRNISQNNLDSHSLDIRVYNSDFADENLAFLKDDQSKIEPFAILGEENVQIEKQIAGKEIKLGSEELNIGLRYNLFQKQAEHQKKQKEKDEKENDLDNKLKYKAVYIKNNNFIYGDVNYDIRKIKSDIKTIESSTKNSLNEKEIDEKEKLIKEQSKTRIYKLNSFNSNLQEISYQTTKLLQKGIKSKVSIQELLNNTILQEWVREGIPYHKGKRDTCAFCGNPLPKDLWEKLNAHFNEESEELRKSIKSLIQEFKNIEIKLTDILSLTKDNFYSVFHEDFSKYMNKLEQEIIKYNATLKYSINELEKREKDIFSVREAHILVDNSQIINDTINKLNSLIKKNNEKTNNLTNDQNQARIELRLNEVAKIIKDINYLENVDKIEKLEKGVNLVKIKYDEIKEKVLGIEKEIEDMRIQQKDERKGADKINEYLNHFFGNNNIKFDAIENEEEPGYKFRILRGSEIAYNLSEGERSLAAFCYFMAKLEDIDTKDKEPIIWIDDPVSSLDNNHVFFVFSLIDSIIAKPYKNRDNSNGYKYQQLFLSTHNIEFLKYLKRLQKPKNNVGYFILQRHGNKSDFLTMPNYLIKYSTEFNYLFHQIYKCSKLKSYDSEYDTFYNFGNNLRKFLEVYLFYKYPSNLDVILKLKKLFKDDISVALVNRIDNEFSHLEEIFDRSMKVLEIPEIPKLAQYVLKKIKEKDPEQYEELLKSIGEQEVGQ
jgi:wobble nucleotide-excising tRNase